MATPSSSTIAAPASEPADLPSELIAARLRQTRRYVKFIDLCTGVATLLVGILAYLLGIALVDHWLLDLTSPMRLVCLLILVGGAAAFFVWRLLPPLLYPVNPVYAAQTIEQAAPSLKNSLINLVLLSGKRSGVPSVIYEGLRRQAAGQLAQVPPETMVDRGPLIKAGYWLVALLALAAMYKVLSPKDPLQSVARIASPWKAIDRPARVKIRDLQPGDVEVYRGQTVEVIARIDGLDDDETAALLYSTSDNQFIDQAIVLAPVGAQRFRATLTTGERGIQQPMVYRLQAGDATTDEYRVRLKDAPHIGVRRVEYQYPAYTELDERVVEGQGDLSAVEGTRVRIEAEANQPIDKAYLELFVGALTSEGHDVPPSQAIPMRVEGKRATGGLTLLLQPDRKTPQAAAYQIRFTTADGQRNAQPARYSIEVTPDLEPDVELLQPRSRDVEIPENGALTVEVRAYDPDFAVRQIRLVGAVGGVTRLNADLLTQSQVGQVIRKQRLAPAQLGLNAGDVMIFWAEAEDNRRAATGTPAPNSTRTPNYRLRVTAPDPSPEDSEADGNDGPAAGRDPGEGGEGGAGQAGSQAGGEQGAGEQGAGEQGAGEQGAGEQGGAEQQAAEAGETSSGQPSPGDSAADGTDDGQQAGAQGGAGGDRGEPSAGKRPEGDETGAAEGQTDDTGQGGGPEAQPSTADGGPADASSAQAADKNGTGTPSQGAETEPRGDDDSTADDAQPVASDGSDDAEAFERILRHIDEQRENDPTAARQRDRVQGDPGTPRPAAPSERDGPRPSGDQDPQDAAAGSRPAPRPGDRAPSPGARPDADAESRGERPDDGTPSNTGEVPEGNSEQGEVPTTPPDPTETNAKAPQQTGEGPSDATDREPSEQPQAEPSPEERSGTPSGRPESGNAESSDGQSTPESGEGTPAGLPGQSTQPRPAESPAETEGQANPAPSGSQAGAARDEQGRGADADDSADEANLDYTRQATDLALEYLREQQQHDELRQRLGWTDEELRAFVQRWEQMRRDTQQDGGQGQQAQRRLQDQLRGLGLQPPAGRVRSGRTAKDPLRQLRQGGSEVPIPAEYLEQYRAFLRSEPTPTKRAK